MYSRLKDKMNSWIQDAVILIAIIDVSVPVDAQLLCPGVPECSGRGTCLDGLCHCNTPENIVFNKSATESLQVRVASFAVDRNTVQCASTTPIIAGGFSWWKVDLGQANPIASVTLYVSNNATEGTYLKNCNVSISNSTSNVNLVTFATLGNPSGIPLGGSLTFTRNPPLVARYLTIIKYVKDEPITICEVIVTKTLSNAQVYTGEDCSIDVRVPPVITGIRRSICDSRTESCQTISIFAAGFALDAEYFSVRILDGSVKYYAGIHDDDLLNPFTGEILITLPRYPSAVESTKSVYVWSIAVSNDNITYSDSVLFVVYDSLCLDCSLINQVADCQQRTTACLIDGKCYDVNDVQLTCNHSTNTSAMNKIGYNGTTDPATATTTTITTAISSSSNSRPNLTTPATDSTTITVPSTSSAATTLPVPIITSIMTIISYSSILSLNI